MWKLYREKWRSVPAHIRKGLLRLYIGVSAVWVIWFGLQIIDVLNSHPYYIASRYIPRLFLTLLFVPIGSPILFIIANWIFEGFRKPQIKIGNLRYLVAMDILCKPNVAAYEFLATGSLFGKKIAEGSVR